MEGSLERPMEGPTGGLYWRAPLEGPIGEPHRGPYWRDLMEGPIGGPCWRTLWRALLEGPMEGPTGGPYGGPSWKALLEGPLDGIVFCSQQSHIRASMLLKIAGTVPPASDTRTPCSFLMAHDSTNRML